MSARWVWVALVLSVALWLVILAVVTLALVVRW